MKWYLRTSHSLFQLALLLQVMSSNISSNLNLHIQPSTVITTRTILTAIAEVKDSSVSKYKFSFGNWKFETQQNKIMHRFPLPGTYSLKASAFVNSTWSEWTTQEILVFDHSTVMASHCKINVTFFGFIESNTSEVIRQGSFLVAKIVISLSQCYGRCSVILQVIANTDRNTTYSKDMISYGANEERGFTFNVTSKCLSMEARITFVTPINTYSLNRTFTSSNALQCQDRVTKNQTRTTVVQGDLRPNKIVAIFYVMLLFLYILDAFIAYRGHKQLLKPVQDLTDQNDEHMYEIRFHVGSGLSIKSTKCVVQFTLYGTNDVIGPLLLSAASFEDDGIASYLVSTMKEIGDVGTIGIFCKNMDLSSDWYLRKVDVFRHSEKPNGARWSDEDVITKLAKFECHSWFSPASCTQSVSQVFHKNNERLRRSLIVDYISRCKQLFFQKHLVTSWKCCYGLESFTKIQRLAFLYSFWLVLTCLTTFFLKFNKLQEEAHTVHLIHIGLIRLNSVTAIFALVSATGTYLAAATLSTVTRILYCKPKTSYTHDRNFRPLHIDIVQSRVVPNSQKRTVSFAQYNNEQTNEEADRKTDKLHNNNNVNNGHNHSIAMNESYGHVTMKESDVRNGTAGSPYHMSLGTNDVKSVSESNLDKNGGKDTVISVETLTNGNFGEGYADNENSVFNNELSCNYKILNSESISLDIDEELTNSKHPESEFDGNRTDTYSTDVSIMGNEAEMGVENSTTNEDVETKTNGFVNGEVNQGFQTEESDGNIMSQNEKANESSNNTVQFLNRETLPTMKENKLKTLLFLFLSNMFWILHFLLLAFSVLYSLIHSASWTSDVAYHWISMSTLGMAISCCIIDTIRVLLYVLLITIKERIKLKKNEKQMTFNKYSEYLVISKRAEFEKREFFIKEFPENKLMMVKNHYRLKGKGKDFLIFALFVVVLLVLTQWTMNSQSFRFWSSLENFLFNFKQLSTIQSTGSVDPVVNFWKWMGAVLPTVLNSTKRDVTTQQLHVIGYSLNLVQKRIKKGQCEVDSSIKPLLHECNVDFDTKYEDRMSYSPSWKPLNGSEIYGNTSTASVDPWHFRYSIMSHKTQILDSKTSYSLDGYIATFNATNIQENINHLTKYRWIDQYTRMVYMEVFIYNPSCNFLSLVVIALEFTPSGYIVITKDFSNFVLFPSFSPEHEYIQFAELIFFVMTFYFIFDIVNRKHRMSSTWLSGWLLTEAIVIILSFVVIIISAIKNLCVYQITQGSLTPSMKAESLHMIAFYQRTLEEILAGLNLFSIILMVKPLFTLGLFDDMYLAVVKTLIDMKGIATETIVIIIAFMFWARAGFVASAQSFSTLENTFPTLMDMLVSPDNNDLYGRQFFGPLLLLIYYCIMILLISNIFISAVQQSYSKARRAFEDMEKGTVLKYFVKSFNKKASRRLLTKNVANKIGTFRRQTNIKRLRSPSPEVTRTKRVENIGTKPSDSEALVGAVNRLEAFMNAKIRKEGVEDRVLVTAMSDGWKRMIEKQPTLSVISVYKKHIRSSTSKDN